MWPISARDFVNLTHWRLLGDGTIVIISFSTPFDDLKPTCNNMVRGDMSTAGYIMRPAKNNGGTEVHFLVEVNSVVVILLIVVIIIIILFYLLLIFFKVLSRSLHYTNIVTIIII